MALRVAIRNAAGVMTEVNLRSLTLDCSMNAEEGSIGAWRLPIDDPTGVLRIGGHRAVIVYEDAATDPLKQYIGSGYTQERTYDRGDLIEGIGTGGRVIGVDVADLNTILGRRVFSEDDVTAKRPAETDVQRFQWASATVEAALIADTRYLMTTNPVLMDVKDYRGQSVFDVLEDCAEAGGKNYFTTGFQTGAIATPAGADGATVISIAYFPTSDYTTWPSGVRLTNVGADVDDVTTFVVESAVLKQSPLRVKSGSLMPYDGGQVYGELAATATRFARIDTISDAVNVTTAAKATARNARILADLATEELRVEIAFRMRPAVAALIRAGMVVDCKFDHLEPELGAGYVPMRMLNHKFTQSKDETGFAFYRISGTFSVERADCTIAFVQSANGGPRDGVSTAYADATLPAAPTPGNLLVAWCVHRNHDGAIVPIGFTAVTPAYVPIPTEDDGTPSATEVHIGRMYYRVVQTGDSATVTADITAGGSNMFVAECSSTCDVWALDDFDSATDDTDVGGPSPITLGGGSVTPTDGPVLVIGGYGSGSGDNDPFGTWTPSSGVTLIGAAMENSSPRTAFAYQIVDDPSGSYAPTVVNVGPNTRGTGGCVAAFRTS